MPHVSTDINKLTHASVGDPDFPHAPVDWTRDDAMQVARREGLTPTEDHRESIRTLQHFYTHHEDTAVINLCDLHDALDEHFHALGGLKFNYPLFPGGPIAQCCRLAGLKAPAIDRRAGAGDGLACA